jgi:hypothetical protein
MSRGVAALLLALVLAPASAAKGTVAVTVCGANGCAEVGGDAEARTALAWPNLESVAPPPREAFYSLRFESQLDGGPEAGYYVPNAGLLAVVDAEGVRTGVDGVVTWTPVPGAARAALAEAVEDLRPTGEPRLTGAEIGFRPVEEPRGYLELFDVEPAGPAPAPAPGDWTPIVLEADRPNPWTNGTRLAYSPSTKALRRGQEILRLPDEIASDLDARAPLAEPRVWRGALAGAAVALVLLLVAVAARGGRRAPRPRSPAAT